MRFLIAAVALSLCLLPAQDKPKSAFDKPTFEAYVRHLLAVIPEVQVKIDDPKPGPRAGLQQVDVHFTYGAARKTRRSSLPRTARTSFRGVVYNFNQNPFKEDLDKFKTDLASQLRPGRAGSSLVLDLAISNAPTARRKPRPSAITCPAAFPTQVRVVFKDFPLEQIHPWAKEAAIAGRCIFRESPAAFWKYHDWIYDHQTEITPENLKTQGPGFRQDHAGYRGHAARPLHGHQGHRSEVDASIAEGRALHVDATPTLFVNGRRLVGNYPWPNLEQIITGELNYQKTLKSCPQHAGRRQVLRDQNPFAAEQVACDARALLIVAGRRPDRRRADARLTEYLDIIKYLASPEMRGRATGSPELEKAAGLHSRPVPRHESEAAFGRELLPGFRRHHQRPPRQVGTA